MSGHRGTLRERFERFVMRGPECWFWSGHIDKHGYAQISKGDRASGVTRAARVAYELYRGPIPEGMQPDHLCRNRECVNPWHLELVTSRENTLRGEGVSAQNARKTHCKNGHAFDEANTYHPKKGGRACRACSRDSYARRRRALGHPHTEQACKHDWKAEVFGGTDGWRCSKCGAIQ